MPVDLSMYKFKKTVKAWEHLEDFFMENFPDSDIRYVCRLTPKLITAGFHILTTPSYFFTGCEGDQYRSLYLSPHKDLPQNFCVVVNYPDSYSGQICLDQWLTQKNLSAKKQIESGSHIESVKSLLAGHADLAAIDCISWGYILNEISEAKHLHCIDISPPIKGHPIIIKDQKPQFKLQAPQEILRKLHIKKL